MNIEYLDIYFPNKEKEAIKLRFVLEHYLTTFLFVVTKTNFFFSIFRYYQPFSISSFKVNPENITSFVTLQKSMTLKII